MRLLLALFLSTFLLCIKSMFIFSVYPALIIIHKIYLGQTTETPNYSCSTSGATLTLQYTSSSYSAWDPALNCSVSLCSMNSNNNSSSCLTPSMPCFDFRTINNTSYCAPGSLCSLLELCDNQTGGCTSNTSVCIINSCCSLQRVCLPLYWTTLCTSSNNTTISSTSEFITKNH